MTETQRPSAEILRDYPRWDETHASTLEDTDDVYVSVEVEPTDVGGVSIKRTVYKKAARRIDRHILWTGEVARIGPLSAPDFMKDIAWALVTGR
jgi:hypothetical protein